MQSGVCGCFIALATCNASGGSEVLCKGCKGVEKQFVCVIFILFVLGCVSYGEDEWGGELMGK